MTRKVLLDANLLIAVFDRSGNTAPDMKQRAIQQLETLMQEPDIVLFITPLIRYEVLRGIAWQDARIWCEIADILDEFPELEITRDISDLSANLFRFDKHEAESKTEKRNLDKRKFDVFHFCCAHCNGLDIYSNDSDIGNVGQLHQRYMSALAI